MLEQSFFAEAPPFRYVPRLKRVPLFHEAKFRVGYTLTYIGQVVQPDQSVLWEGNPAEGLFPSIQIRRGKWLSDHWTFGINWQY